MPSQHKIYKPNNPEQNHPARSKIYLAIDEFKDINGDAVVFVVNGANDSLNGALDGVDAGLQRARVLLGVTVQFRSVHQRVEGRDLHELEVLEPLLFLAIRLQTIESIKYSKQLKKK